MESELTWDLASPSEYQARQELQFALSFSAPEAGRPRKEKFYILGGLYTNDVVYISGSLFGLFQVPGTEYAVNSTGYVSVWELEPGGSVGLPCRLTFSMSDIILGLFLFKMEGDEPVIGIDEEIASISAVLASPAPPWTIESIMSFMLPFMVIGMFALAVPRMLEDKE